MICLLPTLDDFMFMGEDGGNNLHTTLDAVDISRGPHTGCA